MATTPKSAGSMPSPEVIAGQIVRDSLQIDPETARRLDTVLPGSVVPPSTTARARRINPDPFQRLIRARAGGPSPGRRAGAGAHPDAGDNDRDDNEDGGGPMSMTLDPELADLGIAIGILDAAADGGVSPNEGWFDDPAMSVRGMLADE